MAANCDPSPNLGVSGVMYGLAQQYRAAGHEVELQFRASPSRVAEFTFSLRLCLSRRARTWADVVDVHTPEAWPLVRVPRRGVVVTRSHGLELKVHQVHLASLAVTGESPTLLYRAYRGKLRLRQERAALRSADVNLMLSQHDLDLAVQEYGLDRATMRLVPNGFPPELLEGAIAADAGIVAFVGGWREVKGSDVIVPAGTELLRARPQCELRIVGSGTDVDPASEFPEDVRDRVHVVASFQRSELPELLEGAGILLFPSKAEGFPLALVEGMAIGLYPVATAIPGIVEVIRPELANGTLVHERAAPRFLAAVLEVLDDPVQRLESRRRVRDSVRRFAWDRVAPLQLEIYRAASASRRSRRARTEPAPARSS